MLLVQIIFVEMYGIETSDARILTQIEKYLISVGDRLKTNQAKK